MTTKEIKFVKWVKEQCKLHGVKCSLRNVKYLKLSGNIKCSGYFDGGDSPILAVAMNRKDWIEILAHEYCHLTQWVDGIKLWDKAMVSLVEVNDWLSGIDVKNSSEHVAVARDLELDNEKRTASLIKEWGLNVDLDCYIKKANAYIQFYNHLTKTRRWSKPGNSPYGNVNIYNAMPTTFTMRYTKMSKKVEELFVKEGI